MQDRKRLLKYGTVVVKILLLNLVEYLYAVEYKLNTYVEILSRILVLNFSDRFSPIFLEIV